MSRWIFSDTFSIGKHRGVGYSHGNSKDHHKLKTHGAQRQTTRATSHCRKKYNTRVSITLYLRWPWEWAFPGLWWALRSGAAVPRRLRAPISLMREPSRLDIVGSGFSLQPMLFSPQRNKPSYSLIPLWHPWPKCLQSHPPTATTLDFLSTTYPHLSVLFLQISLIFSPFSSNCGWSRCYDSRERILLYYHRHETHKKKMWGHKSYMGNT